MATNNKKPFRIGIIGGMGPLADVLLQKLIIESTPAKNDQDHFQVVCFSNPKIPDRTQSLEYDDGRNYVKAIRKTARALIGTGVDILAIPCNTAHARYERIQKNLSVPIVHMITETVKAIRYQYPQHNNIGVLATQGTLKTQLYEHALTAIGRKQVTLSAPEQTRVMGLIYRIKGGDFRGVQESIEESILVLQKNGAEAIILGCTELSLLYPELIKRITIPIIDPLRILAETLVKRGLAGK
jgi:aspartate racemase